MASGPQMKILELSSRYFLISSAVINPCSNPSFSSSERTCTTFTFGHTFEISQSSSLKRIESSVLEPKRIVRLNFSMPSRIALAMDRNGVIPLPPARARIL